MSDMRRWADLQIGTDPIPLEDLPQFFRRMAVRLVDESDHQVARVYRGVADVIERSLRAATTPRGPARQGPPGAPAQYATTAEVAKMLKLSEYTVREYARLGRLAGAELAGNRWRFRKADLRILPPSDG